MMSTKAIVSAVGVTVAAIFILNQAKKISTGVRDIISGGAVGIPSVVEANSSLPSSNEPIFSIIV